MEPTIGTVFVPGGMPELTYVPRTERDLENRLGEVRDNLCKLVVVTGQTKTGKTVLVRRVLSPQAPLIWVDGGLVQDEQDFWHECLSQLDASLVTETEESSGEVHADNVGMDASIGVTGFKFSTNFGSKSENNSVNKVKTSPTGSLRSRALKAMIRVGATLVIDDFHYLARPLQGSIVRALKGAIFDGFPVVAIAIPHRRYDAIRVEREMNGRVHPIQVPDWSTNELMEIPRKGFPLLKLRIGNRLSESLAKEAYGSPHLMQEFCKELAKRSRSADTDEVDTIFDNSVYSMIAQHTGKVIFDKLASGPRQRTDRIQRKLVSGGAADIYIEWF